MLHLERALESESSATLTPKQLQKNSSESLLVQATVHSQNILLFFSIRQVLFIKAPSERDRKGFYIPDWKGGR